MDACGGVDVELDKVQAKFDSIRQTSVAGIDEVLQALEAVKSDLQRNASTSEDEGKVTENNDQRRVIFLW